MDVHGDIRVQINDYDSYQTAPLRLDRLYGKASQVPVIRLYGYLVAESLTIPVLIHVHNAFPYIYVDYVDVPASEFIAKLESELATSFKRRKANAEDDGIDPDEEQEEAKPDYGNKYIASVDLCRACPIYGFSVGYKKVWKVSLLSPIYKARLTNILNTNTRCLGKKVNLYEAHIPFLLQFMADYNLYGCGYLTTSTCYFRSPIADMGSLSESQFQQLQNYLKLYIHSHNVLRSDAYPRMGRSVLEIDLTTRDINNRTLLEERNIHETLDAETQLNRPIAYLSSLSQLQNEILFQKQKRGLVESSQNISTGHYGDVSLTAWSTQEELDELLKYAIKLNGDDYLPQKVENLTLPTLFQLTDIQRQFPNPSELSFFSDLVMWQDFGQLFSETTPSIVIESLVQEAHTESLTLSSSFDDAELNQVLMMQHPRSVVNEEDDTDDEVDVGKIVSQKVRKLFFDDAIESDLNEESEIEQDTEEEEDKNNVNLEGFEKPEEIKEVEDMHPNAEVISNSELLNIIDDPFDLSTQELEADTTNVDETILQLLSQKFSQSQSSFTLEKLKGMLDFGKVTIQKGNSLGDVLSLESELVTLFDDKLNGLFWLYHVPLELQKDQFESSMDEIGIPQIDYLDPFYDRVEDQPKKPFVLAQKRVIVPIKIEANIPKMPFSNNLSGEFLFNETSRCNTSGEFNTWQYLPQPPSTKEISHWCDVEEKMQLDELIKWKSQIKQRASRSLRFKYSYHSDRQNSSSHDDEFKELTNLQLEIHVNTHNEYLPKFKKDPIAFMFYNFVDSNNMHPELKMKRGVLVYHSESTITNYLISQVFEKLKFNHSDNMYIEIFQSEVKMVEKFCQIVDFFDPDILSGYEINASSWGYLIERFRDVYEVNLLPRLSRSKSKANGKFGDRWGYTHTSVIEINGRHMLNIWRVLRKEVSLTDYSLENAAYHLLHHTVPRLLNRVLSSLLQSSNLTKISLSLEYYFNRIELTLELLTNQELVTRNVEQSRLIGIDFNSNFYRGSQFKIESILSRLAKLENYLLNSPSKNQVHQMKALECIPLILEPLSNFYKSPLLVLDFQSLYPSIMIAYNYCFSTLIGKVYGFDNNKNGVGYIKHNPIASGLLQKLYSEDGIVISPNGFAWVNSSVRKSVLAKMLEEILDARVKLKNVIKQLSNEADYKLLKLFNAKQLALKLTANVTYGYTSATFSGRMPNSDVADAIVSTGREILSKSINLIEEGNFGAKVVYGDTDSLFVYLPGKSKDDAFAIGNKIASYITSQFPDPIKLKFEKVYHPCVLLSKKRYVGYSYEDGTQELPKFDAKGIETIRRDGIPAQQKIVERTLRILFETSNLSKVKGFVKNQFSKIRENRINVSDFSFAKEVKYGNYKNRKYLPPGAIVAERKVANDPLSKPQYKERVPYVVIRDITKPRIKDRSISPEEFLKSYQDKALVPYMLDYEYYITRVLIPPLERIFNLVGADIKSWYSELPKITRGNPFANESSVLGLSRNISLRNCQFCGSQLKKSIADSLADTTVVSAEVLCPECLSQGNIIAGDLEWKSRELSLKLRKSYLTCQSCVQYHCNTGSMLGPESELHNKCVNIGCNEYYSRFKASNQYEMHLQKEQTILQAIEEETV